MPFRNSRFWRQIGVYAYENVPVSPDPVSFFIFRWT